MTASAVVSFATAVITAPVTAIVIVAEKQI
jgi:hypothetical protein